MVPRTICSLAVAVTLVLGALAGCSARNDSVAAEGTSTPRDSDADRRLDDVVDADANREFYLRDADRARDSTEPQA